MVRSQGNYAGKTFSQIFEEAKGYSRWVLMTVEQGEEMTNQQLLRLAAYVQQREAEESGGWIERLVDDDLDAI